MQYRFDIVQVENRGVAYRGGLLPIRRAPEMFDDREFVALPADGSGDLAAKAGEAVHERRNAPHQASGIARGARQRMSRVRRKFHTVQAAHQTGRQSIARVRGG